MISIPTCILRALLPIAKDARTKDRPNIRAIHVGRGFAVATDGVRLVAVRLHAADDCAPFTMSAESVVAALKLTDGPDLYCDANMVGSVRNDWHLADLTYPEWTGLVRDALKDRDANDSNHLYNLSHDLVLSISQAFRVLAGGDKDLHARFRMRENCAAVALTSRVYDAVAIVMPYHADRDELPTDERCDLFLTMLDRCTTTTEEVAS
jgi:hypothetical protein